MSAEGTANPDSRPRGRGGGLRDWALVAVGFCYVTLPFAALGLMRLGDAGRGFSSLVKRRRGSGRSRLPLTTARRAI